MFLQKHSLEIMFVHASESPRSDVAAEEDANFSKAGSLTPHQEKSSASNWRREPAIETKEGSRN